MDAMGKKPKRAWAFALPGKVAESLKKLIPPAGFFRLYHKSGLVVPPLLTRAVPVLKAAQPEAFKGVF
jgi:hypothetical protein